MADEPDYPNWLIHPPMAIDISSAMLPNADLDIDHSIQPLVTVQLNTQSGEHILLKLHAKAAKRLFELLCEVQGHPDFQSPPEPPSRGKPQ